MAHSEQPNRARALAFSAALLIGLCVLGTVSSCTDSGSYDKKHQAQARCVDISQAIAVYCQSSENTKQELPLALTDLVHPPWGGQSYLRNGEADLMNPWGKPYDMEHMRRSDGTEYILVKTTAPDGTPISPFGIGRKNAFPKL